jgi:hypothetical protein
MERERERERERLERDLRENIIALKGRNHNI